MSTRKGQLSVNTQDIFPIIKKWLYSEHDIFIRELVSNASDAITKRTTLSRSTNTETPAGLITVELDKNAKTITITDNGLGMTEAEVEKYIAQLAFSGAREFVEKMNESGNNTAKDEIIGKFGLGFYSAFMVASTVEVESLSMNAGSVPTKWTSNGETDYEFSTSTKTDVGTKITLFINEESKEFLDSWKLREVLRHYCDFMPYSIEMIDANENARITAENLKAEKAEDKKPLTNEIINETNPLWKKDPTTITDDQYKEFYQKMFPMDQEPLFWLHLNVDHPFNLQGILYFPKINPMKPVQENGFKLYSKQVFVSDNVKSIVPDFLALLKGAIDSTDIPLNVSRSSLQGDPNIKKISNYIIKKVAESLKKLFNNDRARYETVWEDIMLFIKYGCVQDAKFDEVMRKFVLFKNSDAKLVTLEEYQNSIPETYKEKLKGKVITFEKNASDESLKKQLLSVGVHTIEIDNYIDPHFTQHSEFKKIEGLETKFVSIDSEFENIMESAATNDEDMKIKELFASTLVTDTNKAELEVEIKKLKTSTSPAYFKVDEQMKKFQQMTKQMGNSAFSMPLKKTLMVNPENPLVKNAFKMWEKGQNKDLAQKICKHVQDLASLSSEGLTGDAKEGFISRNQEIMNELTQFVVK
jgi:molecular chaperone HtpG